MTTARLVGGVVFALGDEGTAVIRTDSGKTMFAAAPPDLRPGDRVVVDFSQAPVVVSPPTPESPE